MDGVNVLWIDYATNKMIHKFNFAYIAVFFLRYNMLVFRFITILNSLII